MTIYRVRTEFTGVQGVPYLSTMYFGFLAGTAQQAATAAGNFWSTVDGSLSTNLDWEVAPDVAHIDETTGEIVTLTNVTGASGTGATAADMLPPANQALVRWRTGVYIGGREVRGRTFIPGVPESMSTDGLPTSAFQTAIGTAAGTLLADANSELLVWSRTHGVVHACIGGDVWNQFAVLRSRRL